MILKSSAKEKVRRKLRSDFLLSSGETPQSEDTEPSHVAGLCPTPFPKGMAVSEKKANSPVWHVGEEEHSHKGTCLPNLDIQISSDRISL